MIMDKAEQHGAAAHGHLDSFAPEPQQPTNGGEMLGGGGGHNNQHVSSFDKLSFSDVLQFADFGPKLALNQPAPAASDDDDDDDDSYFFRFQSMPPSLPPPPRGAGGQHQHVQEVEQEGSKTTADVISESTTLVQQPAEKGIGTEQQLGNNNNNNNSKSGRRKRPRTVKTSEEVESQRMTHIAVERNRRRLMNDHLASLRALIPSSYIPRGDQATVVGGAIDYVKQLEQQLVALQAEAAARRGGASSVALSGDSVFVSPQYTSYSEGCAAAGVDVEAMAAVGGHVRVRVAGKRWPGRLVRAVAAMEDLRLAVLHLAVTSVGHDAVVYCFNLKMEDGCEVATADEVAAVVHQIFAYACC